LTFSSAGNRNIPHQGSDQIGAKIGRKESAWSFGRCRALSLV
jgi:hypothetical protein